MPNHAASRPVTISPTADAIPTRCTCSTARRQYAAPKLGGVKERSHIRVLDRQKENNPPFGELL
jgi:hypothetical protein